MILLTGLLALIKLLHYYQKIVFSIDRLDIMIAYSCNLACQGCISISDRPRDGVESVSNIINYLSKWKNSIVPAVATVFGGEPCLHPNLIEICKHIRNVWPETTIRLITNGYLLDRFDSEEWFNLGLFEIQVSIHRQDHEQILNKKIKNILMTRKPWTTTVHNKHNGHKQIQWQHDSVTVYKSIFKDFVVPYRQQGNQLVPWNSNPEESHKICGSPNTPVLYKGKLYKCPAVANAMDITKQNWFNYQAVDVDDDLEKFVNNIGCPESVCGQCPARSQAVVIDHFDKKNVIVKQKNLN
jgi:organic radical activating enzyme